MHTALLIIASINLALTAGIGLYVMPYRTI